jgi:hypothetical protein
MNANIYLSPDQQDRSEQKLDPILFGSRDRFNARFITYKYSIVKKNCKICNKIVCIISSKNEVYSEEKLHRIVIFLIICKTLDELYRMIPI